MDMDEEITLTDGTGAQIKLPLVNFLRVLVVKLRPFQMQYLEETSSPSISDFDRWLSDKLEMTGKNVLL